MTLWLNKIGQKWSALLVVCMGTFMVVASPSLVGIALPTINTALHADLTLVGWVQIGYQLAITGLLLGLGRLADSVGRKRMYVAGLVIFATGSLLASLSGDVIQLISARVLQAVGAAMTIANNRSILTFVFPAQERGRAMSAMQSASGAGSLLALALGGVIVVWLGWQGVFSILFPLGLTGALLAFVLLDEQKVETSNWQFDWLAAALLLGILTALMFVLTQLRVLGWQSLQTRVAVVTILVFGCVFYLRERKTTNPILDWRLLLRPGFSHASAGSFLTQTSRSMLLFLMPFQFERAFRLTTARIGFLLLVLPMAELLLAPVSGWWADRSGSRHPTTVGMGLVSICLVALAYLPNSTDYVILASLAMIALLGVGFGLFHSANNSAAMGAAPANQLSMASSILGTNITLGMGVGAALASTILAGRLDHYLGMGLAEASAFGSASREVYLATALIGFLALLSAWFSPSEHVSVKPVPSGKEAEAG